jgi:hypothetical protein
MVRFSSNTNDQKKGTNKLYLNMEISYPEKGTGFYRTKL